MRVFILLSLLGWISSIQPLLASNERVSSNALVTTLADDGPGSLRQAVRDASTGDLITFAQDLAGDTLVLSTGQINLDVDVVIRGLGIAQTILSGNDQSRLFHVQSGVHARIENLSLVSGRDSMKGGALLNEGKLSLTQLEISGCEVSGGNYFIASIGFGGAISNQDSLIMTYCRIRGNKVSKLNFANPNARGGAVFNQGYLDMSYCDISANTVEAGQGNGINGGYAAGGGLFNEGYFVLSHSLISFNQASGNGGFFNGSGAGGGLYNQGVAEISNSTLHANTCFASPGNLGPAPGGSGGGLFNVFSSILELKYVTLSSNAALGGSPGFFGGTGGGISNSGGMLTLQGTLLANNTTENSTDDSFNSGSLISMGYNLIENNDGFNLSASAGDQLGSASMPIDPLLDLLADNGGYVHSQNLLSGSPAIDAAQAMGAPLTDQRGYTRPAGSQADIGAIESGASQALVNITDPKEGDCFPYLSDIHVAAEVPGKASTYLKITCPDAGWRKLQMGNNPHSKWSPQVNVNAGGNDTLRLILRDPNEDIDWSKIRIHPDGVTANAVRLADHLPLGGVGADWTRIDIPLSAFHSSIDFSDLTFLEFPYSDKAGAFQMDLQEISFVGGANPFLWFGEGKTDNKQNGTGGPYKLTAELETISTPIIQPAYMAFFVDGQYVGRDSTAPYEVNFPAEQAGPLSLLAQAVLADNSRYDSPPLGIKISQPEIVIVQPDDSMTFAAPASIPIKAEISGSISGGAYLKVHNPDNKWRKLKLSHNPNSIWGPNVDVTSGGNTILEITLRDPNGNADWSSIEVHPQGSLAQPIILGDYLPIGGVGANWVTLGIPLADFDPSINFSSISFLEIPYSKASGPFEIHIQDIRFTGGMSPFVWFGEGKTDNKHDGFGAVSQLLAEVVQENNTVEKVEFFAGNTLIGTDSLAPYTMVWENVGIGTYSVTALATFSTGLQQASSPITITVENTQRFAQGLEEISELTVYPNPSQDRVWLTFNSEVDQVARILIHDLNGRMLRSDEFSTNKGDNTVEVDLSGLASGPYVLTLMKDGGSFYQSMKLIKQ